MSSKLNILISGPGLIGIQHLRLVQARPDCEVVAIVAPETEEHRQLAMEVSARLFQSVEEALDSVALDGAIISSPNPYHCEQALACIERKTPVLVEKPLTDKLDDARALVEAARQHDVPVLVGHHRTYSPLLGTARDFIHSARFGRPVTLQGSALFYKPAEYFAAGPWRTRLGGGPLLINMIHEIGVMRHLYGDIRCVSAFASHRTREFEVEDTVAINFVFENGALGSFILSDAAASSKSWEMTSGENPAYPAYPDESCYHFAGTNGSLDFPSMRARFYPSSAEASWWRAFDAATLAGTRANPLERQLAHFVEVIRGEAEPLVTAEDGYRNMLVIDAIGEFVRRGAHVTVASC